jgi:glycosyltransferase involved in cell wall biosynthesis
MLIKNDKYCPLISIITVSFNSEATIERTIQSILDQKYNNIEHIIIDGLSSDKTLEIIKKYGDKVRYYSEPDEGIYDAVNKGLKLYSGEYVGFVFSDDYLFPDAIDILVKYIRKYPYKDFFFGSVRKHYGIVHGYRPWMIPFSWGFYTSFSPGFFIKRSSQKKLGFFNLKYKCSSDYDYFYKMIAKEKFKGVGTKKNELFGVFSRGGFSSKINSFDHMFECTKIRLYNQQNKILILITLVLKFITNLKRL